MLQSSNGRVQSNDARSHIYTDVCSRSQAQRVAEGALNYFSIYYRTILFQRLLSFDIYHHVVQDSILVVIVAGWHPMPSVLRPGRDQYLLSAFIATNTASLHPTTTTTPAQQHEHE
jgi:hypothetical protein